MLIIAPVVVPAPGLPAAPRGQEDYSPHVADEKAEADSIMSQVVQGSPAGLAEHTRISESKLQLLIIFHTSFIFNEYYTQSKIPQDASMSIFQTEKSQPRSKFMKR